MQDHQTSYTLLLVDDNPTNLQLMAHIIHMDLPHVQVLTAASGDDGLALAAAHQIDGAFIDVQMPGMDGLEVCRRLRLHPGSDRIPLVLMTAHIASPALRAEGLDVGAYDFISKPISNVEMLARIKVMLRFCENERIRESSNVRLQEQLKGHSAQLRWLSGLLVSGGGPLSDSDQQWIRQLAAELPPANGTDDQAFYEKLITDLPLPWRRTLLKLALLECIPLPLAAILSEIADIGAGLGYLKRHQLSLIQIDGKEDCLLFQPQIRTLLRSRAKELLTEQERLDVFRTAADWYRQHGQLLQQIYCLIGAGQYADVSQLLSQVGLELLDQKNVGISLPVIDRVPDDIAAQCGWQSLFRGIVRLDNLSAEADLWLELASQLFRRSGDRRGQVLAWSWQVLQAIYVEGSWDEWKTRYRDFRCQAREVMPSLETTERLAVAHALGLSQLCFAGELDQVHELLSRSLAEAQQAQLPRSLFQLHLLRSRLALHQGRSLVAGTAFEQAYSSLPDDNSFLEQLLLHQTAFDLLLAAGTLSGLRQQQLFLARECPSQLYRRTLAEALHGYYSATLLFARNEPEQAEQLIDSALITARTVNSNHLQSFLIQLRGWIRAVCGRDNAALVDLQQGLDLRDQAGGLVCRVENLLLAGATYMVLDQNKQARTSLAQALELSEQVAEERLRPGLCAWLAVACRRLGQIEQSEQYLQRFFDLLRRQRSRFFLGMTTDLLRQLLPLLTTAAECELLAPLLEKYLRIKLDEHQQPLEMLEVDILGGFSFHKGGDSFDLQQVGQSSRLMLAQLLMTPQQILSTEVLMGQLWPDSTPVKARNNFDAAHSRLRKALEEVFGRDVRNRYLVLEKGMVSLNHVRIDAQIYLQGMETARYHQQREQYWQAEQTLWRLERLWKGEFLNGFDIGEDLVRHRGQFNHLRLEQLEMLARLLLRRHCFQEACDLLRKGLVLDPTADAMIRPLLEVCRTQGDVRAAEQLLADYGRALKREGYDDEESAEQIDSLGVYWLRNTTKTKEN
ncbi:MAG: response regulator [Pelovirga sp.]